LLADVSTSDDVTRPAAGLEWRAAKVLTLRGGVSVHDIVEVTAGAGLFFDLGPLKPAPETTQTPKPLAKKAGAAERNTHAVKSARRLAAELDNKYQLSVLGSKKMRIVVLPLNSTYENFGPTITEVITNEFANSSRYITIERWQLNETLKEQKHTGPFNLENATALGKLMAADLVVLGSIDKIESDILINTRLINVQEGYVVATALDEIAEEDLPKAAKSNLSLLANPSAVNAVKTEESGESVDFGFDYAFTNRQDLGSTHTISFKILY
jgi:TolB-like protein